MAFQTFKRRTAANSLEAIGAPDGVINVRDGEGLVIDTNVLAVDAVNNRVGINVGSPSKALEIDGDIQLTPTAISTAHVTTTGSLRLRCTNALWIGDNDADAVRIGRTNTALAPIYLRSGGEHDLVVSGSKVGIGVESPSVSLEIDGDIKLSPTAISTAHVTSSGSLTVRADSNIIIGDSTVDSIKVGRTNTAVVPIHFRSGGDNDLVVKGSKVGIGTDSPDEILHLKSSTQYKPELLIENTNDDEFSGVLRFYKSTTDEAASDQTGLIIFTAKDAAGADANTAWIVGKMASPDAGAEEGSLHLGVASAGSASYSTLSLVGSGTEHQSYFLIGDPPQAASSTKTGINTSVPAKLLDINAKGSADGIQLTWDDADGSATDYATITIEDTNGKLKLATVDSDGAAGHIVIIPDGNVGINDSSPSHTLDVDGDINLTGGLSFDDGTAVTSIDTDISSVSGSDDTLASAKAIKSYVDTVVTAQDLDFQGDSGGALSIDLDSETLTIAGTANEIETSGSGNTLTIGLPNDVTIAGNLTVNGTTTTVATDNTVIEDKLIELANGTTGSPSGDAGIVVERGSSDNAAFVWDESEDRWVAGTTSATGASSGNLTITPTDLNVSDLAFTPDGITTSHITTAGSLRIRADNNIYVGDDGADSVHIGRTNTSVVKVHLRSGASEDLVVSGSKVGIGTDSPGTQLQVDGSAPYITLRNSTAENSEGGAESRIIFEDHADVTLGQLEVSHSGTADDTKGKMILSTHNGTSLTTAVTIDDAQNTTFAADIITASTRDAADASGANAALSVPGGASVAKALYVGTTLSVANDTQFLGDTNTFSSANSTDPLLIIKNTTSDANGARLRFVKDKGAAGAASDVAGLIEFYADDANQDQVLFSEIKSQIRVATDGQEGGKLTLSVASHDGESQPGLIIVDGDAEDEVDVTIGNGAASLVTVPGDIDVDGTANLDVVDIDGYVDINPGASAGSPALRVVSSDVDQVGFKVESTNTTAHAVSINCDDSLTTGNALHIDHNDAATSAVNPKTVHIDFDKDGVTGDGVTSGYTLMDLDMNDGATNHANATVQMIGLDLDITSANAQGTCNNYGLVVDVSGGDVNMAAQLTGNSASMPAVSIINSGDNANRWGLVIQAGTNSISGTPGSNVYAILKSGNGSATNGIIVNSGASDGNVAFAASSDERLKQDIAPTKVVGLDVLNKIEMSEFRWKKDGPEGPLTKLGFVAQNCEEAYPEMVAETDADLWSQHGELDHDVKTVSPSELIPVMVKAIQELSDNNKALLNRIEELEGKLS